MFSYKSFPQHFHSCVSKFRQTFFWNTAVDLLDDTQNSKICIFFVFMPLFCSNFRNLFVIYHFKIENSINKQLLLSRFFYLEQNISCLSHFCDKIRAESSIYVFLNIYTAVFQIYCSRSSQTQVWKCFKTLLWYKQKLTCSFSLKGKRN